MAPKILSPLLVCPKKKYKIHNQKQVFNFFEDPQPWHFLELMDRVQEIKDTRIFRKQVLVTLKK